MKSIILDEDKNRLRYLDSGGSGNVILFIHGLGCASSFEYPNVITQGGLQKTRCILADLLGYGYSDHPRHDTYSLTGHAQALRKLVDHLDPRRLTLFGHSMGGAIAIELAELIKDRVDALIVSEGNLDAGGGFYSRKIASYTLDEYVRHGHAHLVDENILSGNTEWANTMKHAEPRAVHCDAVDLIEGRTPSWREKLYDFPFKKTYLFGEKSLPDDDERVLQSNGITVRVVKDAGHNMALENPLGLAEAIVQSL
jgi:pimeloyl-ACP methyl ester carboxylesterase